MKYDLVIKNAYMANGVGDIAVMDGCIEVCGQLPAGSTGRQVFDAAGHWVLPGGVDVHTHFSLRYGGHTTCDGWAQASASALAGGTTTVLEHLSFGPDCCSPELPVMTAYATAVGRSLCDYGFHGIIQHISEDLPAEMEKCKARGVKSWLASTAYEHALRDVDLLRLMEYTKSADMMLCLHCADNELQVIAGKNLASSGNLSPAFFAKAFPADSEAKAIRKVLALAKSAGDAPIYLTHVSTADGLEEIREARRHGQKNIYVEVFPQHLLLTEELYAKDASLAALFVSVPPLRSQFDVDELWQAMANNEIDVVASNHRAYLREQKLKGIKDFNLSPTGLPGVEERLTLLLSEGVQKGRISFHQAVDMACTRPASLFGLQRKGQLDVGYDADIVCFDPAVQHSFTADNLHGAVDFSAYSHLQLQGRVEYVWSRGDLVYENGNLTTSRGRGIYINKQ